MNRVLLSTIGTRGDVQPLVALAQALRDHGHAATLVTPPDFGDWITSLGFRFVPMGPPVRQAPPATAGPLVLPSPERRRALAAAAVHGQFATMVDVVPGHDLVVAAGALQFATRSAAELAGVPYHFAAYCPTVLPSPSLPPAQMGAHHAMPMPEAQVRALWEAEELHWDELFGPALAAERTRLGLPAVDGVLRHVQTDRPLLAAEPILAPLAGTLQTGAWRLVDPAPLPAALEAFLDRGEPPIYLGFGSMRPGPDVGMVLLAAARAVGRRAVVSRGWGGLAPEEPGDDWIAIDDVAHDRLFPRVAAVVHHGGAGTTTSAAMAGRPQVIVPHHYDQPYWAHRVEVLGLGASCAAPAGVAEALERALRCDGVAIELGGRLVRDGAQRAVDRLLAG